MNYRIKCFEYQLKKDFSLHSQIVLDENYTESGDQFQAIFLANSEKILSLVESLQEFKYQMEESLEELLKENKNEYRVGDLLELRTVFRYLFPLLEFQEALMLQKHPGMKVMWFEDQDMLNSILDIKKISNKILFLVDRAPSDNPGNS